MSKTFILDTSVLMHDSNAFLSFEDNFVIIPITVLEELDNLKEKDGIRGSSARKAIKQLAEYLDNNGDGLVTFCDVSEKGVNNDDKIICCAAEKNGILVTRDLNCRVKAFSKNVPVQYYKKDTVEVEDECLIEMECSDDIIDLIYKDGEVEADGNLFENQPVILKCGSKSCLCVYKQGKLIHMITPKLSYISPKDVRQRYAFNFVMDDDVPLCILEGRAGTGKTIISLAAALEKVNDGRYNRVMIAKPTISVGENSLGYLPGPQPLFSKVLTPTGWVKMGDIKVGDFVIGRNGEAVKVIKIFDKGIKPVYRIETETGSCMACGDHLWLTKTETELKHKKDFKLRNTFEIKNTLFEPRKPGPNPNHNLPTSSIVHFDNCDRLAIPPYIMGVLLGSGKFGKETTFVSTDSEVIEIIKELIDELPIELEQSVGNGIYKLIGEVEDKQAKKVKLTEEDGSFVLYDSAKECANKLGLNVHTVYSRCRNESIIKGIKYEYVTGHLANLDYLQTIIYKLGLYRISNSSKFIPDVYKYSSVNDRIELLRGLMDVKGDIIDENGKLFLAAAGERMAKDIAELILSLSVKAVYTKNGNGYNIFVDRFRKDIIPFRTSYKADVIESINEKIPNVKLYYNKILNVEYEDYYEVRCLLIDSEDHLYITDNYIVTHNTIEEKLDPWLGCIHDNLSNLGYTDTNSRIFIESILEPMSIEHIRGRSLSNCFVIIEETQNVSGEVLKTILTRAAENTKVVVCGDLSQIDSLYLDKESSGLAKLIHNTKESDLVSYIKLSKCVRSELADFIDRIL